MKRTLYSITAFLLASLLLVGCTAEVESSQIDTSQIESVEESSRVESVESSEIVDESSTPEEEESVEDKFAGIASFDTEFNEENVIYYDGYMGYPYSNFLYPDGLDEENSTSKTFSAYQNASDDDWFVVAFVVNDDVLGVINHVGAIEIKDHPFSKLYDWYKKIEAAKSTEEKQALYREQYESLFPEAKYKKDPNPTSWIHKYNYVGYFTKPMILELEKTYFDVHVPYTFMPEIGNNECWFKNLK